MEKYEGVDYVDVTASILRDAQGSPLDTEIIMDPQFDDAFVYSTGQSVVGAPIKVILLASSPFDMVQSLIASNTRGLSASDFNWHITIRPYNNPYAIHLTREGFYWLPYGVAANLDLDSMKQVAQADGPLVKVPGVVSIGNLTGIITEQMLRDELGVPIGALDDFVTSDEVTALLADRPSLRVGHGAPGTLIGAEPGWAYLDLDTGDLYELGA